MKKDPEASPTYHGNNASPPASFSVEGRTDRPRRRPAVSTLTAVVALVLAVASLGISIAFRGQGGPLENVREFFRDPTPHEEYLMGLSQSGLASSALGQKWMAAARTALERPLAMAPPYQEEGFFPSEEPSALGYRFSLKRGQRLMVEVDVQNGDQDAARLFVDLFRSAPDTLQPPVHVLSPEPGAPLVFEWVFKGSP